MQLLHFSPMFLLFIIRAKKKQSDFMFYTTPFLDYFTALARRRKWMNEWNVKTLVTHSTFQMKIWRKTNWIWRNITIKYEQLAVFFQFANAKTNIWTQSVSNSVLTYCKKSAIHMKVIWQSNFLFHCLCNHAFGNWMCYKTPCVRVHRQQNC